MPPLLYPTTPPHGADAADVSRVVGGCHRAAVVVSDDPPHLAAGAAIHRPGHPEIFNLPVGSQIADKPGPITIRGGDRVPAHRIPVPVEGAGEGGGACS